MAYEIFSVKLYELDEKIRRLHSRIQMSESAQHRHSEKNVKKRN